MDFSSLLQLGFGTGIALGLFQAPIRFRLDPLAESIKNKLVTLEGVTSDSAQEKIMNLQSLQIDVATIRTKLERRQRPALCVSLIGAFINLVLLAWAAVDGDHLVGLLGEVSLLGVSIGWFLAILAWMELLALDEMSSVIAAHKAL